MKFSVEKILLAELSLDEETEQLIVFIHKMWIVPVCHT